MENFAGQGGSYTIGKDGVLVQTVAPTADHPEGNMPRAAPVETDTLPVEAEVAPARAQPKKQTPPILKE